MELSQSGGLSQIELSRRLHVRPPTVAVMLQRMEKADLICRRQDERDQRVTRVYLTEKGREVHRDVQRMIETIDRESLSDFTLSVENLSAKALAVGTSYLQSRDMTTTDQLYRLGMGLTAVCDGDVMPPCRPA